MGLRWICRGAIWILTVSCLWGCSRKIPESISAPTVSKVHTIHAATSEQTLPYTMEGSTLVAEKLMRYQGCYWEDRSGEIVTDVAALMLYNPTERLVEFGAFVVEQGKENLYFFVYQLPPMSRCLILEKNRKAYTDTAITRVREMNIRWDYPEMSREQVDYLGFGPYLTIINREGREQDHVTLRYKQYVKDEDYYLGGIAYSAHFFRLLPEERRTLRPENYVAGESKIVSVRIGN
ncbi:MAG: hypothetical protein E7462_02770 [Ruminococcaceae bacterium]|nr:hypothetical protein [Oscillospiraceae bacterium]